MSKGEKASYIIEILAIIIAIILIANLIRSITNTGFLTFESFINQCSNFSSIPFVSFNDLTITADWALFNFFRDFLNLFTAPLTILIFIATNLINALLFVVQFVGIFFA